MFDNDAPVGGIGTLESDEELALDDDDAPLSDAEAAELARVAQIRLDRMFPRTGPARSAWRLRRSQRDARARRAAKKILIDGGRRSGSGAALPRYGTTRSASALPGLAGPGLAAALADLDLLALSEHDLVHVVTATERLASWASATQAEAISVLSGSPLYDLDPAPGARTRQVPAGIDRTDAERIRAWQEELETVRATGAEVAAALRLSRGTAERRVTAARALTSRHPATLAALRDGVIDLPRARVILDELDPDTTGLSTGESRAVENAVLDRAGNLTAAKLQRLVRHERIRLAPSTAEAEHQQAKTGRRVEFRPAEAGMGWLNAYLPADAVAAIRAALDAAADTIKANDQAIARAHARANPGCSHGPDLRTIDQCRADALAEMAWLALDTGHLGGCPDGTRLAHPHGHRPRVQVTIPLSTLLGLDQHPGHLDGYGPIPPSLARNLAARGDWYRILTDPRSGTVLDVGTTRYAPPADLAHHVQTRDRTCRGPGCGQPAHRTDTDHTIEYPTGPTAAHNLGPLCRNDHLSKHRRGWRLTQPSAGVFEWTSPAGHTHPIAPEQVGPLPGSDQPTEPAHGSKPPAQPDHTTHQDNGRVRDRNGTDPPPTRRSTWYHENDNPPF